MFKSIAMATLALLMTVDMTGNAGKDLYTAQKEAQQRIAEEALDDDTTCLEENPYAYMTDETVYYGSDYDTSKNRISEADQTDITKAYLWMTKEEDRIRMEKTVTRLYPDDYRGQIALHSEDASIIMDRLSGYQYGTPSITVNYNSISALSGIATYPNGYSIEFIMKYDSFGPTSIEVPTKGGNCIKNFKLDRGFNILSCTYEY